MQDRHRRIVEIFLLRTAGPYIWVNVRRTQIEQITSAVQSITDGVHVSAPLPERAASGSGLLRDHM